MDEFTDDLATRRVDKAPDNLTIRPMDLLKAVIKDIETGEVRADGLVVLIVQRPKDGYGRGIFSSYRCGCTWDQEYYLLGVAQDNFMQKRRGQT